MSFSLKADKNFGKQKVFTIYFYHKIIFPNKNNQKLPVFGKRGFIFSLTNIST